MVRIWKKNPNIYDTLQLKIYNIILLYAYLYYLIYSLQQSYFMHIYQRDIVYIMHPAIY